MTKAHKATNQEQFLLRRKMIVEGLGGLTEYKVNYIVVAQVLRQLTYELEIPFHYRAIDCHEEIEKEDCTFKKGIR